MRSRDPPRGWKLQKVEVGQNQSQSEKIREIQIQAAVDSMEEMIKAKKTDADRHMSDRCDALTGAVAAHRASVERIMYTNPTRYANVDLEQAVDLGTFKLAEAAITAEADADAEFDKVVMKKAEKQQKFRDMKEKQNADSADMDKPSTRGEMARLKKELGALKSQTAKRGRPSREARSRNTGKGQGGPTISTNTLKSKN